MEIAITNCALCPRRCGTDRTQRKGPCGGGAHVRAAKAMLHHWEEPCISGKNGSGAVFFSGCPLGCCFCQNAAISHRQSGKDVSVERLSDVFLSLQARGAHNINLVTPTHYVPWIKAALERARLSVPIVYNTGGYERLETLQQLDGLVQVYLPDLKFYSPALSRRYTGRTDYFAAASAALLEMYRQTGRPVFSQDGLLCRGLLVRHLVLPGNGEDSKAILHWLSGHLPKGSILLSLMRQYTPYATSLYPELNRRLTTLEYDRVLAEARSLGFAGYGQQRSSAKKEYTPTFDGEGL